MKTPAPVPGLRLAWVNPKAVQRVAERQDDLGRITAKLRRLVVLQPGAQEILEGLLDRGLERWIQGCGATAIEDAANDIALKVRDLSIAKPHAVQTVTYLVNRLLEDPVWLKKS